MKTNEEYRLLEQQLATKDALYQEAHDALDKAEKQNVLLRELLEIVQERGDLYSSDHAAIRKALDATADLAGLVVCDAVPVGSVADDCNGFPWKKINYVSERLLSELPIGTKLYAAKEKP
jgi:hypothetical protein